MNTIEITNYLNDAHSPAVCKTALRKYLQSQLKRHGANETHDPVIAGEIASLMATAFAKELRKNYLPQEALNLGGYLELPEHHRAGVTWQMLADVINAIGDTPSQSSITNPYDIQDRSIPFLERRRILADHLRQLLVIGNEDPSQQTDIAYWLAGMLGMPTSRDMRDDYRYYTCLDLAQKLTLPEDERPYGSWHTLTSFVGQLDPNYASKEHHD
jgi:hypothetical protein